MREPSQHERDENGNESTGYGSQSGTGGERYPVDQSQPPSAQQPGPLPGGQPPQYAQEPAQPPVDAQSGQYAPPGSYGASGYPAGQYGPPTSGGPKQKNVVGIIALVCAIIGFIFACIPGALVVGWVLLPIAFILSIVSLFLKYRGKRAGIAALIVSVVGTIVGAIVFFVLVASAFDSTFDPDDFDVSSPAPTVSAPATEPTDTSNSEPAEATAAPDSETEGEQDAQAEQGTREAPLPIGTTVTQGDWELTVNSVNLDATQEVLDEESFNEKPNDGDVYVLVNITMKYLGDESDGLPPFPDLSYVTADGHTRQPFDSTAVPPDPIFDSGPLYQGAEATGNVLVAAPADSAAEGTIAVRPDGLGNKIYFAAQ